MWDALIQLAVNDGIWALLFCILLIFELKDSRTREKKYQTTIERLSQDLSYMNTMSKSIDQIQDEMRYILDRGNKKLTKEYA